MPLISAAPSNVELALIDTIRLEIEQGKKLTYWHIGKHIKEHLLKHTNRANYGDYLFKLLADNLEVGQTNLYLSVQFYETYPQIVHLSGRLTWTHIRTLLTIPEKAQRQALEATVVEKNLSVSELKDLIHQTDSSAGTDSLHLPPLVGQNNEVR